ncbi:hypothetical protein H9P43_006350 [Blastocladiella emersonii ATCC 22665]|nr:hypothetical protein H9P43_006350 [Blastocladiella emersonii ATCC 22665]
MSSDSGSTRPAAEDPIAAMPSSDSGISHPAPESTTQEPRGETSEQVDARLPSTEGVVRALEPGEGANTLAGAYKVFTEFAQLCVSRDAEQRKGVLESERAVDRARDDLDPDVTPRPADGEQHSRDVYRREMDVADAERMRAEVEEQTAGLRDKERELRAEFARLKAELATPLPPPVEAFALPVYHGFGLAFESTQPNEEPARPTPAAAVTASPGEPNERQTKRQRTADGMARAASPPLDLASVPLPEVVYVRSADGTRSKAFMLDGERPSSDTVDALWEYTG